MGSKDRQKAIFPQFSFCKYKAESNKSKQRTVQNHSNHMFVMMSDYVSVELYSAGVVTVGHHFSQSSHSILSVNAIFWGIIQLQKYTRSIHSTINIHDFIIFTEIL